VGRSHGRFWPHEGKKLYTDQVVRFARGVIHLRKFFALIVVALLAMLSVGRLEAVGPIRISFWHYVGTESSLKELKALTAAFNAGQQKYQIDETSVGNYTDINIKLIAALRANDAPAMAMVDNAFFARLAQSNQLAPLNAVLDLPAALQADLVPVAWNYGQVNNQRFGLPWATSILLLYYNADALKARGIAVPKTWPEFAKAAKTLSARGTKGAVFFLDAWLFGSLVTGLGGSIFDANGVPDLDGPASLEGVRFLLEMQKSGALNARTFNEAQAGIIDLLRTKVFFAIAPSGSYTSIRPYSVAFNLAATTLPGKSVSGEAQLVAFKGASLDQQKGMVEFWKFLLKTENQERWAKASFYIPVRKSVTISQDERGIVAQAREGLERAVNFPPRAEMQEWRPIINDALERIFKGGADPQATMAEAQKKMLAVPK
jgi:sn-glycerol 3-phosphate transport system substrate-binding protein